MNPARIDANYNWYQNNVICGSFKVDSSTTKVFKNCVFSPDSKMKVISKDIIFFLLNTRPGLHENVFIENDIVFNEYATIVFRLHVVFVPLSYRFQPSTRKRWKRLKTVKISGNLLFAYQDNLNNLWLLLYRFQKFAFSVKPIIVFDCFRVDARWKRKEKFAFRWKRYEYVFV